MPCIHGRGTVSSQQKRVHVDQRAGDLRRTLPYKERGGQVARVNARRPDMGQLPSSRTRRGRPAGRDPRRRRRLSLHDDATGPPGKPCRNAIPEGPSKDTQPYREDFRDAEEEVSVLSIGLRTNPTRCGNTIVAAAILYNIALSGGDIDPEEEDPEGQDQAVNEEPEPEMDGQQGRAGGRQRNAARERLIRRHFE